MKARTFFVLIFLIISLCCSKCDNNHEEPGNNNEQETELVYPICIFESYSDINKTTSWFATNMAFEQIFSVRASLYWGFEETADTLIPFNFSNQHTWSPHKNYYWYSIGGYIYTDLTGDGHNDLWSYYYKHPWPTDQPGLHLFSPYEIAPLDYDLQIGLTYVRKPVLADLTNDGFDEIVLFSHGYDADPFPGDSIGIFYPRERTYQYLSDDIGFFHGGATGDINNNGLIDIVAYCGGGMHPVHPTAYINEGNRNFRLANDEVFQNFTEEDNYYTVELFDMSGNGKLDLLLGSYQKLIVIYQNDGVFDRQNATEIDIPDGLAVMDIAFLDLNHNNKKDLIVLSNKNSYNGYEITFFYNHDNWFENITDQYIGPHDRYGFGSWMKWIRLFDIDGDGDLDIVGVGIMGQLYLNNPFTELFWRNNQGFFEQVIY